MTAVDFGVFGKPRWQAGAALPGHDLVSPAIDARGGHGHRLLGADPRRFDDRLGGIGAAVKEPSRPPGGPAERFRTEWESQSDHGAAAVGEGARQCASINPAGAPADDADPTQLG